MALVPMKLILDQADRGGYGVGAFNVNNMEQVQAIMEAARDARSPVILQASRGALQYTNLVYLRHLVAAFGSAGHNDDYAPTTLSDRQRDYQT